MNKAKIKWSGGRYGECPYIILGDNKYYIQDRRVSSSRYEYALMVKRLHEGFDFEFRSNLSDWDHGQFRRAVTIFERWYRMKYKSQPLCVDREQYSYRYERGHLAFWIDKPYGKPPRLICRSIGSFVDGWYESMGACKRDAERLLALEIEKHQNRQNEQLSFDLDA